MNRGISGPPTSPPDPAPLSTHEHEWSEDQDTFPMIEDGAAIFIQECIWTEITGSTYSAKHDETFYEEGAKCDATRSFRMEEAAITKLRDDAPDITYLASELDHFWLVGERADIDVRKNGEIVSLDPDEDFGEVIVEGDNWRVRYEA